MSVTETLRWLIEIAPCARAEVGPFEDVGAQTVEVEDGCLVFRTAGRISFIRAAGTWLTVAPENDGEE